jgi:hypothetical protein
MSAGTRVVGLGAAALGALTGGIIADVGSVTSPLVVAALIAVFTGSSFLAVSRGPGP